MAALPGASLGQAGARPAQPLEGLPRRGLLGRLLGGALAGRDGLAPHEAAHPEAAAMAGAVLGHHLVLGHGIAPRLETLLQDALVVPAQEGRARLDVLSERLADEALRR